MPYDHPRPLADLLGAVSGARPPAGADSLRVRRVVADAREARPGDLFVAVVGHQTDGHDFVGEAVRRGAVAVVAEREPASDPGVPVILVPDTRLALAELAAAWYGQPARRLRLVGITGTFGKTGTLNVLRAILQRAGIPAGVIGSDFIGVHLPGRLHEPQLLTTPDPLALHQALARIAEGGARVCALEVTSQGLVQDRVHDLEFALGIFTSLAPLEHGDYHGSFRSYVAAKARFFEHLPPGAPLVYPAADRLVRELVAGFDVTPVSCGGGSGASVRFRGRILELERTRLVLEVRRPLPVVGGGRVEPVAIPLELHLLGRTNVRNAVLAAAAGLCLGAAPEAVRAALAAVRPPPRRLQFVHRGRFHVLDDAATHPESLGVLFEIVDGIPHRRLHLVTAIRGGRGPELNRRFGETIAIWARKRPVHRVIATSSEEAVAAPDRVAPEEREAFLEELRKAGLRHTCHDRLDEAIHAALARVRDDDLVVLLGAQGMHPGADLVRRWLLEAEAASARPMYRRLDRSTGNIFGYAIGGKLTEDEVAEITGELEAAIRRAGKARVLCLIENLAGAEPGVIWEDLRFTPHHNPDIERFALVGDAACQQWIAGLPELPVRAEVRYFDSSELQEAWDWVRE